ncbi:hypothetical protein BASA61_003932 [Batrachochytrium salamandrivorans]|nr:hypothetical protein BASA61_003932 [Batrachochytrium salamandrivorans]
MDPLLDRIHLLEDIRRKDNIILIQYEQRLAHQEHLIAQLRDQLSCYQQPSPSSLQQQQQQQPSSSLQQQHPTPTIADNSHSHLGHISNTLSLGRFQSSSAVAAAASYSPLSYTLTDLSSALSNPLQRQSMHQRDSIRHSRLSVPPYPPAAYHHQASASPSYHPVNPASYYYGLDTSAATPTMGLATQISNGSDAIAPSTELLNQSHLSLSATSQSVDPFHNHALLDTTTITLATESDTLPTTESAPLSDTLPATATPENASSSISTQESPQTKELPVQSSPSKEIHDPSSDTEHDPIPSPPQRRRRVGRPTKASLAAMASSIVKDGPLANSVDRLHHHIRSSLPPRPTRTSPRKAHCSAIIACIRLYTGN